MALMRNCKNVLNRVFRCQRDKNFFLRRCRCGKIKHECLNPASLTDQSGNAIEKQSWCYCDYPKNLPRDKHEGLFFPSLSAEGKRFRTTKPEPAEFAATLHLGDCHGRRNSLLPASPFHFINNISANHHFRLPLVR
jgi:hypothetical protein